MGIYTVLLLAVIACASVQSRNMHRLNVSPVCYKAKDNGFGEFTVAVNASVEEFRLVRRSGYLNCDIDAGGFFGCELYHWALVALDEPQQQDEAKMSEENSQSNFMIASQAAYHTDPSYMPTESIQHHTIDTTNEFDGAGPELFHYLYAFITDTSDNIISPAAPHAPPKYLLPGLLRPAFDVTVDLPLNVAPFVVTIGEQLRIWHGEDLANDEAHNSGELCVDIYAISKC